MAFNYVNVFIALHTFDIKILLYYCVTMALCICFIRNLNVCVIVQSECNVTFVSTLELLTLSIMILY